MGRRPRWAERGMNGPVDSVACKQPHRYNKASTPDNELPPGITQGYLDAQDVHLGLDLLCGNQGASRGTGALFADLVPDFR